MLRYYRTMDVRRLSILGVGLLGGSVGLACRRVATNCQIAGYGHRPATLQLALARGAIDEAHDDPTAAVRGADLVVLCTPVGLFDDLLRRIAPALAPGAIVTDVGSTKRSVVAAGERLVPAHAHFVGSHPMAGSERRGVGHADAGLFHNALCILTPTARTNADALTKVDAFWQSLGMRTVTTSPEDHDRRVCDVSHLPHAVAAAMVLLQEDAALDLAGRGFLDATRIAAGDGALWRDIFVDNADNLRAGVTRLRNQLDELTALLAPGNADQLKGWLDRAADRRAGMSQGPQAVEPT